MKILVTNKKKSKTIILPYWQNDDNIKNIIPQNILILIEKDKNFPLKPFQKKRYFINDNSDDNDITIIYLGKKESINTDLIRQYASLAYNLIKNDLIINNIDIYFFPTGWNLNKEDVLNCGLEGLLLTSYKYKIFKKAEEEFNPQQINFIFQEKILNIEEIIKKNQIISKSVFLARDITNGPANFINIDYIEDLSKDLAKKHKFKIKVFKTNDLKKMGFNLLLAVGNGGSQKPRLIELEYKTDKKNPNICLIGKGIVFDSGGLNLKPSGSMEDMKSDMAGAATILGIFNAVASLKIQVNITGLLPLAENSVDSNSYRPGDIIVSYNKKSVEIKNTDAEGRLILADALSYSDTKKYDMVIDFATLTGAAIIALGTKITAGFFRNSYLRDKLLSSSKKTGEMIWELPLFKDYKDMLKNEIADLSNIGNPPREAGSVIAALFLSEFVENKNWIHLDIAGPAFIEKDDFYNTKGATGVMIRTIIDFLQNYVDNNNRK